MDLSKLFETQRVLDERIALEHPPVVGEDRLAKKILALQVELGELANEWRGFKFWSKNQEPCLSRSEHDFFSDDVIREYNPLLEEYVDCLHFILSIGNYIHCKSFERLHRISLSNNITKKFNTVFKLVADLEEIFILMDSSDYELVFNEFIELGEMLGFAWEQIEQAYYDKNAINHTRQNTGY